jgi:transmembrane sensor
MSASPLHDLQDDTLLARAVDWVVLLDSGRATEEDRRRFRDWLDSHPAHDQAWRKVDGLMAQPLSSLQAAGAVAPVQAARHALLRGTSLDRRKVLRLGGVLAGLSSGAWLLDRHAPLTSLAATHATHTGERGTYMLADGSRLMLNARSAVDVAYDAAHRLVRLRQGELYAETAPDPRPFVIDIPQGQVTTRQAHLCVRLDASQARVCAVSGELRLTPRHGESLTLTSGQSALLSSQAATPLDNARAHADWTRGILDVQDLPLQAVVERLRPYQAGLIRVAPDVAAVRVFGVYRLDDPAQALQAMAETLPVRVTRYGPWLTVVTHA